MKYVSDSNLSKFLTKLKGIFAKKSEAMSQADADARYLQLSGGTMTGSLSATQITATTRIKTDEIYSSTNNGILARDGSETILTGTFLTLNTSNARRKAGSTLYYDILDHGNTAANPTLAGTEENLTSLKLNGVNYKVGGGNLYRHCLYIDSYASKCFANIITDSPTAFTLPTLKSYLYDCGYINSVQKFASASGFYDADNLIVGICTSTDKTDLYLVTSQPNHSVATLNSQASSMVDTVYQIM